MQSQRILVGELQLGQSLNRCVATGNKKEFDLLLAMLSQDIRDQDQFLLEQATAIESDPLNLRDKFELPQAQTLSATTTEQAHYSLELANTATQESLLAARLLHNLRPDALHFAQPMKNGLPMEVFDSLSPTLAQRHMQTPAQPTTEAKINMDELILAQQQYQASLINIAS